MSETATYNTIVITVSAVETYTDCMTLIAAAYKWIDDLDSYESNQYPEEIIDGRFREERDTRNKLVCEMELSFLRNWSHLVSFSQQFDGPIRINRDSDYSFFWSYEKSGYHGGLIFHKNHSLPKDVMVGNWSIHT